MTVVISFPAGGEYVAGYTPADMPTGAFANDFSWTANASQKAWVGVNTAPIPQAGGGRITFTVTGVTNNTNVPTTLEVFLTGDTVPANDNVTTSLTVPVKLSSFDVKYSDCDAVNLEWVTETETNNKGFEIERSTDGRTFDKLHFIPAAERADDGSYHYSFQDESINGDKANMEYYYRLVQIDLNGRSRIIGSLLSVNLDCQDELSATIYPIPAYNILTYKLSNNYLGQDIEIRIYSNSGQLVYKGNVEHVSLLENEIDVSKLQVGLYQIRFISDTGAKEYKFMKMK